MSDRRQAIHRTAGGPAAAGFTLIELMVAMGVTLLLLLFINGVFRSISSGVSAGLATSDIVHTSRVISDQIASDAENMVGPDDNGVLVITNQWINDVRFTDDDPNPAMLTGPEWQMYQRRADTIMFIRSADGLDPMTPVNTSFFTPASGVRASFAKVTYGHAVRVSPDGLDYEPYPVLHDLFNEFSAEWVLGRQATLLATELGSAQIYGQNMPPNDVAPIFKSVVGASPVDEAHEGRMINGLTDIVWQGLTQQDRDGGTYPAMVGQTHQPDDVNPDVMLFRDMNRQDYLDVALGYTYAFDRLQVNPEPIYDPEDEDRPYAWWQMMQMHPMLASGVTDFIVEFAGDYEDQNLGIHPGINRDGEIDIVVDGDAQGRIRWYSIDNLPPGADIEQTHPGDNTWPGGEHPIVDDTLQDNADPARNFTAFVFRHGNGEHTNWPHLIRIRYRITDRKAQVTGQDDVPGRMYEQIIRVPR